MSGSIQTAMSEYRLPDQTLAAIQDRLEHAPSVFYKPAGAESYPQDLTVHATARTMRQPTFFASAGAGDVTINDSDITTSGDNMPGIQTSSPGDTVITAGNVTTSGNYSPGILASGAGKISITTGDVSTSGYLSHGISAFAGGDIAITTGNVTATGPVSYGVYAISYNGGATIQVQNVFTEGGNGTGILAVTSGDLTVSAQDISTVGVNSRGVWATSNNGEASVTAAQVNTNGTDSAGLFVWGQSTDVTLNGSLNTYGIQSDGINTVAFGGDATVRLNGSVHTHAGASRGVYAVSQYEPGATGYGSITIEGGTDVTTEGGNSVGVLGFALGTAGSVSITVGTVETDGKGATGIFAGALDFRNSGHAGNIMVDVQKVSTSGNYSPGILAINGTTGGNIDITVHDSVNTRWGNSSGIEAYAYNGGDVKISVANNISTLAPSSNGIVALGNNVTIGVGGTISTQGDGSAGVAVEGEALINIAVPTVQTAGNGAVGINVLEQTPYNGPGSSGITITSNSISTTGDKSSGIYAITLGGDVAVNVKDVSTRGANSYGVLVSGLNVDVQTTGTVSTLGNNSPGLAGYGYMVNMQAATVTTTGDQAPGIVAFAGADAKVTAASVSTSGANSPGVHAYALGNATVDVQNVATTGQGSDAIDATLQNSGTITVGVSGKVSALAANGVVTVNPGGATNITVTSAGSVSGAGDAIQVQSGGGAVTLTNAGVIAGGSGFAIDVMPLSQAAIPGAQINNTGVLVGAVSLLGGNDVLTNAGTFVATKDSAFGAGNDLFVNTGKLVVQPGTKPGNVTLLGLEQFQNSGLIDLRNGVAGDTLTLPGNYVASGKAALGVDIGANGVSDKLIVAGSVTGTTSLLINATAANATLFSKPVTLIQAGTGTSNPSAGQPGGGMNANSFTIANQSVGFVAYGLSYNAATNSFQLTAQAGSPVYRLAKASEGAQSVWREAAGAWESHMAELRDLGDPASRVWGQAFGKVDKRDETRSVAVAGGTAQSYDLGYRQDYYGAQAGVDLAGHRNEAGNGLLFGVTGGYLSSHLNFHAGADRLRFETADVGGYANFRAGALFANLLGQYAHYHAEASNSVEQWSDGFSGNGYGVEGEVGVRLGSDKLFAEPMASLAWQKTDLGTLQALGQSLDFGHDTALTGKLGARVGGSVAMAGGGQAIFYLKGAFVHEFKGKGDVLFTSGGSSETVSGTRLGDYGQAALGVDFLTTGRLSGFIEADADAGGSTKGGGGRVGVRFKL